MARWKRNSQARLERMAKRKHDERFASLLQSFFSLPVPTDPTELANFRLEFPTRTASRYVRDRQAAAVLAKPREKKLPRRRVTVRALKRQGLGEMALSKKLGELRARGEYR